MRVAICEHLKDDLRISEVEYWENEVGWQMVATVVIECRGCGLKWYMRPGEKPETKHATVIPFPPRPIF